MDFTANYRLTSEKTFADCGCQWLLWTTKKLNKYLIESELMSISDICLFCLLTGLLTQPNHLVLLLPEMK